MGLFFPPHKKVTAVCLGGPTSEVNTLVEDRRTDGVKGVRATAVWWRKNHKNAPVRMNSGQTAF